MVDLGEQRTGEGAPPQLPDDFAALTTLFPRITTATLAVVVALAFMRRGSPGETWDKAMFVGSVALAVLVSIYALVRPPKRATGKSTVVFSVCATAGLLVGIARVERPELTHFVWEGFGASVAILSVCIAIFLWPGLDRIQATRWLRSVLNTAVAALVVCDLVSLFRTLGFLVDATNNRFLLNDMLAPAAGKVPDGSFVSSYVTLYGWVLVPFHPFVSPRGLAELATVLLSVLGLLSVAFAVIIAYRSMSSPSFWLAAGLVVPLTCVTVLHLGAPNSSIGSYMQELPERMFPAMLVSLLGLEELARLRRGILSAWHLPALGALAGLILWNTQDFGVAVIVAYTLVLAVGLPRSTSWRSMVSWCGGVIGGLALYPLLSLFTDAPVKPAYFGLFTRAFVGGYAQAPIQVPGPVLVVLPLLLSSAAVGWCLLWRQRRLTDSAPAILDRTVLTLAFVGTWATLGFLYYLNRSYASAQLQLLLMPCGVCLVALVSLGGHERAQLLRSSSSGARRSLRISLCLFPVALLVSVGFGALLQSPDPGRVVKGLTNPPANYGFDSQIIPLSTVQAAQAFAALRGGSLGYFGSSANYVHLVTGLPNLQLFDEPIQFDESPTLRREGCRYLEANATTFLLVSPTDLPGPLDLCGLYAPVAAPDLAGQLFVRNGG